MLGDRYLGAADSFASADIVHAEELSYWFSAEAARRKRDNGFRLVQTVWETLPLMDAYRNRHARRYRPLVLAATDLFLPATERAADALRLEGVEESRIRVCPPGSMLIASGLQRTVLRLLSTRSSRQDGSCGRRVTRTC